MTLMCLLGLREGVRPISSVTWAEGVRESTHYRDEGSWKETGIIGGFLCTNGPEATIVGATLSRREATTERRREGGRDPDVTLQP